MKKYLSLVTFSHTIFAMPFALIGFFLAVTQHNYAFEWHKLILMLLCMVFARNSAMAFNRYIDKKYDALNPRTSQRDIPSGRISNTEAIIFIISNSLLFSVTTFFINKLCFYLSPIALLVVMGYSLTKRYTSLCHIVLGIGLGLAPIGAYLVVSGSFAVLPILYSFAVMFWVAGFDVIYALQDDDFDRSQQLNSIPVFLGRERALFISRILHFLSFGFIVSTLFVYHFSFTYLGAVLFFGAMLVLQQRLVKKNDLSKVNMAFFTTNGIASSVFSILFLLDIWLNF